MILLLHRKDGAIAECECLDEHGTIPSIATLHGRFYRCVRNSGTVAVYQEFTPTPVVVRKSRQEVMEEEMFDNNTCRTCGIVGGLSSCCVSPSP